jgi:hypothetical protein
MTRTAQCHCGQVSISCEGEPAPVIMCSCRLCQRRTGAPVHIGAWFPAENVRIEGETKSYTRTEGDMGQEVTHHFCPDCGTSIWWEGMPGKIGIAGGCFADPDFPIPTVSTYERTKHRWINAPEGTPCFETMPPMERSMELFGRDEF